MASGSFWSLFAPNLIHSLPSTSCPLPLFPTHSSSSPIHFPSSTVRRFSSDVLSLPLPFPPVNPISITASSLKPQHLSPPITDNTHNFMSSTVYLLPVHYSLFTSPIFPFPFPLPSAFTCLSVSPSMFLCLYITVSLRRQEKEEDLFVQLVAIFHSHRRGRDIFFIYEMRKLKTYYPWLPLRVMEI